MLLRRLAKEENKGILLVHHDPSQLIEIADEVLVLEEGRSVFFGGVRDCLSAKIIERTLQCQRYEIKEGESTRYFFL
jgi:ABC-type multidrug transport system ATPase subunit